MKICFYIPLFPVDVLIGVICVVLEMSQIHDDFDSALIRLIIKRK